jgi:iron complex outermembrane receptor protein
LHWQPTDRLNTTLVGSYSYVNDGTFASEHVEPGTLSAAEAAGALVTHDGREAALSIDRSLLKIEAKRVGLDVKYDLGAAELVSLTGYVKTNGNAFTDVDTSVANSLHLPFASFSKQFSQEVQLRSTSESALSWIGGVYYFWFKDGHGGPPHDTSTQIGLPRFVSPADLLRPGASFSGVTTAVTTKSTSAFAQVTYKIFENTRLTAGLRYTDETKGVEGFSFRYVAVPGSAANSVPVNNGYLTGDGLIFATTPLASMDLSKTWKKATWRVALDHKFTDEVMAYASLSRGFKGGAYAPANINPTQQAVNPEVLDAYEVGLKSELFDRSLRVNVSGFYYDYKDIQLQLVNSTGRAFLQNAAAARLYGLDLDTTARITTALTLRGGLTLLNSKYKKFPNAQTYLPNVAGVTCPATPPSITMAQARQLASLPQTGGNCNYSLDVTGQDLVFAPKASGNVGVDYDLPVGDAGRVLLSSSLYYNSGYDFAPGGLFARVKSFEELSASVTWFAADDRYYVRVWGQNLTDNRRPLTIQATGAVFREISARPISYGVTAGFRFGG